MDCREVLANRPAADTEERPTCKASPRLPPRQPFGEIFGHRFLHNHGSPHTVRGHHSPGRAGGPGSCWLASPWVGGKCGGAAARERPPSGSFRRWAPSPFVSTAEVMTVSSRYLRPPPAGIHRSPWSLCPYPQTQPNSPTLGFPRIHRRMDNQQQSFEIAFPFAPGRTRGWCFVQKKKGRKFRVTVKAFSVIFR